MNLLLKNATLLESQNPFHKQQVDIEITNAKSKKLFFEKYRQNKTIQKNKPNHEKLFVFRYFIEFAFT